jgi:hypothetical protein
MSYVVIYVLMHGWIHYSYTGGTELGRAEGEGDEEESMTTNHNKARYPSGQRSGGQAGRVSVCRWPET